MSGTTYLVAVELQTKGNLVTGVEKVSLGAKAASVHVSRIQSSFSDAASGAGKLFGMFDGAVSKVADIGFGIAKWGGLAATGAATYGVLHLNNELEQTKIALGAIFQANGVASDLPMGMRLAQDTIAKMRVDAQKLPGEFEDLRNIFTSVAIPGFQSGASIDQLRDMSGKIMAFAKVAQIPMDMAARESAMLLGGRAGAHNVLGMKLAGLSGDKAKEFNHEDAAKRFADVGKYLDKYKDSIDEFGKSWEGISSTSIDYGKQLLTIATQPLFEKGKETLGEINQWFLANRGEITKWGEHVGWELGHGFEVGKEAIKEWWPAFKAFGDNAYSKLSDIWERAEPAVKSFGDALQSALKDPGTLDKLELIAKLWAGGKAVSLGADLFGGISPIAKFIRSGWGLGGAANAAGAAGGGASVMRGLGSVVGGVGAAVGDTAAAAKILGWGPALAGGAEAATASLLPLAPAALAVGAAFAAYETYQWFSIQKMQAGATAADAEFRHALGEATYERISILAEMNVAEQSAAEALYDFRSALEAEKLSSGRTGKEIEEGTINPYFLALAKQGVGNAAGERNVNRSSAHPGGGGGTHIAKIEITVSGNDEPNRVAALVVDKLNKQTRHRRTSPYVQNFSRGG